MPPKKKEKEGEMNSTKKHDVQADHELFLQAFESKLAEASSMATLSSIVFLI